MAELLCRTGLAVALLARRWVPALDIGGTPVDVVAPGLVLMVAGSIIRVWSVLVLGRFFNGEIEVGSDHAVVATGPYRWIRHPSHTGVLLVFLGFGLGQANWMSLVAGIALPVAAYLWRIKVEEAALAAELGDAYLSYATNRRRLVPWVY